MKRPRPRRLPVGVSVTVQYNNASQRARDLPEDRHYCYSAHIGWQGRSYARNFRIEAHGEKRAFELALAWRCMMARRFLSGAKRVHPFFGKNRRTDTKRAQADSFYTTLAEVDALLGKLSEARG